MISGSLARAVCVQNIYCQNIYCLLEFVRCSQMYLHIVPSLLLHSLFFYPFYFILYRSIPFVAFSSAWSNEYHFVGIHTL